MMRRLYWALALGILGGGWGCSDDDGVVIPKSAQVYRIPTEISFEDAALQAVPGDTLEFLFSPLPLAATVTFQSSQTPLVLIGNKTFPTLSAPAGAPAVRFLSPKSGTRVERLSFSGGSFTLHVSGAGAIQVADCRFRSGQVQLYGTGTGLTVQVEESLFREAAVFGIEVDSGARLDATRVTVADAGDCGIAIGGGSRALITSSIFWRSVSFGVACIGGTYETGSGCNDVYLSGVAPFSGCTEAESDFHVDPLFCGQPNGDFSVQSVSFCAPANSGGCGQVGAFLPGCEPPPMPPGTGSPPSR